jgi:hypothetical protein
MYFYGESVLHCCYLNDRLISTISRAFGGAILRDCVQSTWVHSGSGSSSERIVSKLCCILLTKLPIWLSVLQCFWIRESYNTPDISFVYSYIGQAGLVLDAYNSCGVNMGK